MTNTPSYLIHSVDPGYDSFAERRVCDTSGVICLRRMPSSTPTRFGRLLTQPTYPCDLDLPQDGHDKSQNLAFVAIDRLEGGVVRQEPDMSIAALERLHGGFVA